MGSPAGAHLRFDGAVLLRARFLARAATSRAYKHLAEWECSEPLCLVTWKKALKTKPLFGALSYFIITLPLKTDLTSAFTLWKLQYSVTLVGSNVTQNQLWLLA